MKPTALLFAIPVLMMLSAPALAGVIELPQTGQTTCCDASGNTTSCSGSGQDGGNLAGVSWPDLRFTDNGDGTVTDNLTGLMWMGNPNCLSYQSWQDSFTKMADFNANPGSYSCSGYTAGYNDWRMPNVNELESLINAEKSDTGSWLNTQGFSWVPLAYFWSSTTDANSNYAWRINMMVGTSYNGIKTGSYYMWPVRADTSTPAQIGKTGQTSSYTTGDDGNLSKGVAWPAPRFTDQGDGTVTDNLTGLAWLKDANCFGASGQTWEGALNQVSDFNANPGSHNCSGYTANLTGWRLPNRKELRSLIDRSRSNPALPSGHPFTNVQSSYYWSGTTYASTTSNAWGVDMWTGRMNDMGKSTSQHLWPVRGGSSGSVTLSASTIPTLGPWGALVLALALMMAASRPRNR